MSEDYKIDINIANFKKERFPFSLNRYLSDRIRKKDVVTNIIVSLIIYLLIFSIFIVISNGALKLNPNDLTLFGFYLLSLTFGAVISRKFNFNENDSAERTFIKLYISILISLTLFTIFVYLYNIPHLNRAPLLVVFFSGLVLESYYFTLFGIKRKYKIAFVEHKSISVKYLLLDAVILTISLYIWLLNPLKSTGFGEKELVILSAVYISWIISAATTHKFVPLITSDNRWNAFELQIKFYIRIILFIIISLIFLNFDYYVTANFIKAVISYSIVSSIISMFLFADKIKNKSDEPTVVFLKAYEMKDPALTTNGNGGNGKHKNGRYAFKFPAGSIETVNQKFQFEYLKEYSGVFSVLDTMLELETFDTRKSIIIKSDQPYNPGSYKSSYYQLIVNLHILNDQIKLNDYILDVRNSLVDGGVFVGALLPHHYRYKRYLKKYSFWTAHTLYFFDFLWKRVFPKLPLTREIYFTFSKEKDRALSLAEGLGRLVYCGFKILDLAAVDDVVYFAALKNGSYKPVKKFFYSPIFKMKRVGKNGKIIYVYKFRTMYPYSEFIQDFVYKHNRLEVGGKFKDDFRVPAWGKLFRKLWIDELPMLINWVKRDLKFVGVRPISEQYLSLYSKEHQHRRMNFKPGLVPPFYADLPETIEEIELSEKRYFDAYEKNPIKTDIKYFFKAMNNILVKHKRSA
jgi:lipopolysaccharide/colanic/teichoic acid biosynthesis glycosyltransferase